MGDAGDPLICPSCKRATQGGGTFCSQCGMLVDTITTSTELPKPKWYYNLWFVLFMLFFVVGPFGLPLVWKNPRFSRWVKMALTLTMVVYTLVLVEMSIRAFQAVMEGVKQFNSTL